MSTASDLPSSEPMPCPDDAARTAAAAPMPPAARTVAENAAAADPASNTRGNGTPVYAGPVHAGPVHAGPTGSSAENSSPGNPAPEIASPENDAPVHDEGSSVGPSIGPSAGAGPVAADDPRLVLLEGAEAERLVVRHQAGVWRYLRAMGCDVNEADDLTQDTFVSVLRRPFTDYGEVATSAYLRRVAFSRLVSIRRKSGREKLVGELHELDIVWGRLAGGDQGEAMLEALQLCLKSLSDRARLALQLRYRDRVPRAGIADALEITEHGVKNLMQRAKKQLRTCIERRIS